MKQKETNELHGWDDEKIYFWDKKSGQELCVSDEKELYNQLVKICCEYFKKKFEQED